MKRSSFFPAVSKKTRGTILLVAVGTLAFLSILGAGAASSVSQELKLSTFLTDSNTSPYMALSGIQAMKAYWRYAQPATILSLYGLQPRTFSLDGRQLEMTFVDEEGLIHITRTPQAYLLKLPGINNNQDLVNEILAHPPVVKEELLGIKGLEPDAYAQMKDLISVYGDGKVNINTAGSDVLSALGLSESLIRKIREFRAGEDGQEGTKDDGVFTDLARIPEVLEPYGISSPEREQIQVLIFGQRLKLYSGYVRINLAVKNGKKTLKTFHAVVELSTGMIRRWDEE